MITRHQFQLRVRREIELRASNPQAAWQGSVAERLRFTMARLHEALGEHDAARADRAWGRLERGINRAARGVSIAKKN